MSITVIKCKEGNVFSMSLTSAIDAWFKFEMIWYKAQGCTVTEQETGSFGKCECDHHKSLDHDAMSLFEEIQNH